MQGAVEDSSCKFTIPALNWGDWSGTGTRAELPIAPAPAAVATTPGAGGGGGGGDTIEDSFARAAVAAAPGAGGGGGETIDINSVESAASAASAAPAEPQPEVVGIEIAPLVGKRLPTTLLPSERLRQA